MLIEDLVLTYESVAKTAQIRVPDGSVLAKTARDILEMVTCYAGDSRVFFTRGDLVNAFAAVAYGYGWIDAGTYLGYMCADNCGMPVLDREFPADLHDKLEEKVFRYGRMLTGAVDAVMTAPDSETVSSVAAMEIHTMAKKYLEKGNILLSNDYAAALSAYSYGYGWLDCGVRAGLFVITGNRHLFSI